jgi:hypothetical protein
MTGGQTHEHHNIISLSLLINKESMLETGCIYKLMQGTTFLVVALDMLL